LSCPDSVRSWDNRVRSFRSWWPRLSPRELDGVTGRFRKSSQANSTTMTTPRRPRAGVSLERPVGRAHRRCAHRWQVFGLAGGPAHAGFPYRPSLPRPKGPVRVSPVETTGHGVRSHSPLRGSPGFPPGSLLRRPARRRANHRRRLRIVALSGRTRTSAQSEQPDQMCRVTHGSARPPRSSPSSITVPASSSERSPAHEMYRYSRAREPAT
jgi:hypothetical protein